MPDFALPESTEPEVSRWAENAKDFFWAFNGLRPDGTPFALNAREFVEWCGTYHQEYLDPDSVDLVDEFVLSLYDAYTFGDPTLEGTVAVTIRPDVDGNVSYAKAARDAAERHYDPVIKERFLTLAARFDAVGFDKNPAEVDTKP